MKIRFTDFPNKKAHSFRGGMRVRLEQAWLMPRQLFDYSFLSSLDSVKYKQSKEVKNE